MRATSTRTNRRQFLRGGGAALTLPYLESLASQSRPARAAAVAAPVRFACLFMANGVEPADWWATGSGKAMKLGPSLAPLEPFKSDLNFIHGLYNEQAKIYGGPHIGKIPNVLSGAALSGKQSEIRCGTSLDQVVAAHIGSQTPVESMVLGIEPTELRLEDSFSMIYASTISWRAPTKPCVKEIFPARAFDQLVDDVAGRAMRLSILDAVLADSKHLRQRLGRTDRPKLDEYLESVRDIEQRLDRASREDRLEGQGWRPLLREPDMPRPAEGLPQDVAGHMKLMLDIIVLAFRMDRTRIATCMFNNDLSQMNMGFLPGVAGGLHLDISHHRNVPEVKEMYRKCNRFHVAQYAYLIERLRSIEEGDGTMLDNAILMFCSSLMDGQIHDSTHMPFLVAGRGGGLKTGRALSYIDEKPDDRRACSLHLSLMDHLGVHLDRFGDADRKLARL